MPPLSESRASEIIPQSEIANFARDLEAAIAAASAEEIIAPDGRGVARLRVVEILDEAKSEDLARIVAKDMALIHFMRLVTVSRYHDQADFQAASRGEDTLHPIDGEARIQFQGITEEGEVEDFVFALNHSIDNDSGVLSYAAAYPRPAGSKSIDKVTALLEPGWEADITEKRRPLTPNDTMFIHKVTQYIK